MPSSGELRLRTFILALIALGGIWIALVIQRGHHAPAASFAAGLQPSDVAPPKLVRSRLRTFILALIALGGIWIALVIQRGHHAPAASFAAGLQPSDVAPPKLV